MISFSSSSLSLSLICSSSSSSRSSPVLACLRCTFSWVRCRCSCQAHKWRGKSEKSSAEQEGEFPNFLQPLPIPHIQGYDFLACTIRGSLAFRSELFIDRLSLILKEKVKGFMSFASATYPRPQTVTAQQKKKSFLYLKILPYVVLSSPSLWRWQPSNSPWVSPHSSPTSILFPDLCV